MLQNTPQVVKNLIILNVLMYVVAGLLGDARSAVGRNLSGVSAL